MKRILCEICGRPGSRFNPLCKDCMNKTISKTNTKISDKTLSAIEELDAALETIYKEGLDPEGGKEN